ncbi:MAG: rRNA maturation RNase YbeY [Candidatus Saganbacteria bacterium]|nr:rRNA maturation RNase YbeY [Candidatus Saganbacteria bacterium]
MRRIAELVVKGEALRAGLPALLRKALQAGRGKVEITFVDDAVIRSLNRKFRKIDKATDVLSFNMDDEDILGEVVISKDTAKRNAARYAVSYEKETERLVIHGTLHLLGFGHDRKSDRIVMRKKETYYAEKIS